MNETRNLIRAGSVNLREDPRLLQQLTRWTALFPWTVMSALRGEQNFGAIANELPPQDRAELHGAHHAALYAAERMSAYLRQALKLRLVSDIIYTSLDQNVQQLVGYLGGCEHIRKTPLPFAYVVHLRRSLVIYCFTLPFALVGTFGWWTVLSVFLVAYTYFGVEEIGVEIEGPFGNDANHLPLEEICLTIQRNLFAMAEMGHPEREALPEGL